MDKTECRLASFVSASSTISGVTKLSDAMPQCGHLISRTSSSSISSTRSPNRSSQRGHSIGIKPSLSVGISIVRVKLSTMSGYPSCFKTISHLTLFFDPILRRMHFSRSPRTALYTVLSLKFERHVDSLLHVVENASVEVEHVARPAVVLRSSGEFSRRCRLLPHRYVPVMGLPFT